MKDELFPESWLKHLGVVDWGYTEVSTPESFRQFDQWINTRGHGPLGYLADHRKNLRADLKAVFPEFQSALVFLFSYRPAKKWLLENNQHRIASYALGFEGEDYHYSLKRQLQTIQAHLLASHPELKSFITLDTQPVLERDLAYRAGLGWFGKNSMLINREHGSYFIIGSLLLNQKLKLEIKPRDIDHCGNCTACADQCPTNAIDVETRTLRAQDCISTFTIELMKEASPPKGYEQSRGEIFGCDICQDVCPWNKKPIQKETAQFKLKSDFQVLSDFMSLSRSDLKLKIEGMTSRGFQRALQGTALSRPGRRGWLKNFTSS